MNYRLFTAFEAKSIPNGATIKGSSFDQEVPDTQIFRPDMRGVTFVNCNLDNVVIPPGNTLVDCRRRRFKAQTDGNDWLVDGANKPVMPINHKIFAKRGIPLPDPKKLPASRGPRDKPIDYFKDAK